MNPLEPLKQYWGYNAFRPLQEEIIQAVLEGKDVLALLPTGGGKSICFQVPTLMRPGLCLVVSPLIALMKDQVDQLKKRDIAAEALYSGMAPRQIDLILDNCIYGAVKFLYVSPERLKTELLQERMKKMNISLLAVDEAHCISQWGYDFRPPYLEIATLRELLPDVSVIALTATATPAVSKDIQEKLAFRQPICFQQSFTRENLAYVVRKTEDKEGQLLNILRHIAGTAIVYVNTRRKTQKTALFLQRNGIKAAAYHAGLTGPERDTQQEAWVAGTTRVIVATNAFGMGIDKPNVRVVVHLDLPTTLEAYYQEAGRAGRDAQKAYAVLMYDDQDITLLREAITVAHPSVAQLKGLYQHLANYYHVAVGSHNMTTHDFDLQDFAHAYGLNQRVAYNALKALEREGLVQLSDSFFQPAQLHIARSPKELYAFQVSQAAYDPLIKAMLRLYGGELFSSFIRISVQYIARVLKTTPQAVEKQLQPLNALGIVTYTPQKSMPQLTFTTARHPAASLPIAVKALNQRSTTAQKKEEAVIAYVMHQHRCRPQLLLEYFSEVCYQQCGQCDVCLAKKRAANNLSTAEYEAHRRLILERLQAGMREVREIVNSIAPSPSTGEVALATIRQMLDNGELAYDSAHRLTVK
jgi:ATP-dependent DNA helicase RecQ